MSYLIGSATALGPYAYEQEAVKGWVARWLGGEQSAEPGRLEGGIGRDQEALGHGL